MTFIDDLMLNQRIYPYLEGVGVELSSKEICIRVIVDVSSPSLFQLLKHPEVESVSRLVFLVSPTSRHHSISSRFVNNDHRGYMLL